MLRLERHHINMALLTLQDQEVILNACLAAAHLPKGKAAVQMREQLEPLGWYVYEGGHHLAIGKEGQVTDSVLKLIDITDPFLSMGGLPEYLCAERRKIGLSVDGTGS